jgi:hypothetical protein
MMDATLEERYAILGRYVAAKLGANREWDSGADYLGDIAYFAWAACNLEIGSQSEDTLAHWRKIADDLGIEHDGEEIYA